MFSGLSEPRPLDLSSIKTVLPHIWRITFLQCCGKGSAVTSQNTFLPFFRAAQCVMCIVAQH